MSKTQWVVVDGSDDGEQIGFWSGPEDDQFLTADHYSSIEKWTTKRAAEAAWSEASQNWAGRWDGDYEPAVLKWTDAAEWARTRAAALLIDAEESAELDTWDDEVVVEAELVEESEAEVDLTEADLPELAALANKWHHEATDHMNIVVTLCIKAGRALLAAKEQCKASKDSFMMWVESSTDIKHSTANKYMQLATAAENRSVAEILELQPSMRAALTAIGKPMEGKKKDAKPKPKSGKRIADGDWSFTLTSDGLALMNVGGVGEVELAELDDETAGELMRDLSMLIVDMEKARPHLAGEEE
jgi:hypothetical protein